MKLTYRAYHHMSRGLFGLLLPFKWLYERTGGQHQESLRQRLGCYPKTLRQSVGKLPRIWIHAVSVGEVKAAFGIIKALLETIPEASIIVSAATAHGKEMAEALIREFDSSKKITCLFAPLDFPAAVRAAMSAFRPDLLAFTETEIWPNWLVEAHRMGINTVFVNGRISDRTIKGYLKVKTLFKAVLENVDAFSMINAEDARRIQKLGAPAAKIRINGNVKFDLSIPAADDRVMNAMRLHYRLSGKEPVMVAGSIRGDEARIIMNVYARILRAVPQTLLIAAPRHMSTVSRLAGLAQKNGFDFQLRSNLGQNGVRRTAGVVILDIMGELQDTYSIASIVFCGGSLVPKGGQNILEPAAWGKPVLYGPSMEDFRDAERLLKIAGGGIRVKNEKALAQKAIHLLCHPDEARKIGSAARQTVLNHKGAARKHARVIADLLT